VAGALSRRLPRLATSLLAHVRWFYHPGTGFSSPIWLGEPFAPMRIGPLAEISVENLSVR